jgi:hypothetical protein
MNTRTCCRNAAHAVEWIGPSVGLALVPKCPACVAAYVAAFTGIGISMSAASWLRMGMLILCSAVLVFVAMRRLIQWSFR